MKSFIAMFLLIFAMASCGTNAECDCAKCLETCKVEAAAETTVDSTAVAPAPVEVEATEAK